MDDWLLTKFDKDYQIILSIVGNINSLKLKKFAKRYKFDVSKLNRCRCSEMISNETRDCKYWKTYLKALKRKHHRDNYNRRPDVKYQKKVEKEKKLQKRRDYVAEKKRKEWEITTNKRLLCGCNGICQKCGIMYCTNKCYDGVCENCEDKIYGYY